MLFSLSQRTINTTTGTAAWEIIAGANNKPKVLELGFSSVNTAANVFGIGRPAATGITPTSPQSFLCEEYGDGPTGQTKSAVAWGTGPTVPANFFKRLSCSTTINAGAVMVFPRGFPILAGASIVLWNLVSGGTADVWCVVDE